MTNQLVREYQERVIRKAYLVTGQVKAAKSRQSKRRRVNIHIGEEEYHTLVELAGGPKRLGRWVENAIRASVVEEKTKTRAEIMANLKLLQGSIAELLQDISE